MLGMMNIPLPNWHQVDEKQLDAEAHAVMETAVDAIITINRLGVIESFNPSAERPLGWHRVEVIGRNVSSLMPSPTCRRMTIT